MRVVLDANVVVSAVVRPSGVPGQIVSAAIDGHFELIASALWLTEVRAVLIRPRFRRYLTVAEAHRLVDRFGDIAEPVDDVAGETVSRDPGDDYLVHLARTGRADVIVTGDEDLLVLAGGDHGIVIESPRQFLERWST